MGKPFLKTDPNHWVGGYTLDCYCKYENDEHEYQEFPHTFFRELGSAARRDARKIGWILHKDGTATCPKCAKTLRGT